MADVEMPTESGPSMLALSARGDKTAQGALAAEILRLGDHGVYRPLEAWAGVEIMARLAASHEDPIDIRTLAAILCLRGDWEQGNGDPERAIAMYAEAVQLFDRLADSGDEDAADALNRAGRFFPASVFEKARGASLIEI